MYFSLPGKRIVDVLMLVAMFFAMGFHLLGTGVHKGIGLLAFLLFFLHNLLNRAWYKRLRRGKYSPVRIVHTLTIFLVILAMAGVMATGVMLSKELAQGLTGMTTGRMLHNASSYAGCIGIALHMGFHLHSKRSIRYDD